MTEHSLAGMRALVTGASGGIGGKTAELLGASGAHVVVHFHGNRDAAQRVCDTIVQSGGSAQICGGDIVSAAAQIARTAAGASQQIDILVNGAGTLQNVEFGSITEAIFNEQFHANVLGMIMMSQAAVPYFPAAGGQIVNISTNLAYDPLPGATLYAAAKSSLIALTHGFARELGKQQITMNAVAPGATKTRMIEWAPDDMLASIADSTPLGRIAEPQDVAEIIAFLASPQSRWINGRTIIVDGGLI